MREDILKILKNSEVPMTELEIQSELSGITLDKLCEKLRTLEKCGDVYVTKKGKYTLYEKTHLKVGKLSVNKKGFGFVILQNEPDIHIKKENMNGAIHNDLVAAEYISEEEGKIVRIYLPRFELYRHSIPKLSIRLSSSSVCSVLANNLTHSFFGLK